MTETPEKAIERLEFYTRVMTGRGKWEKSPAGLAYKAFNDIQLILEGVLR